MNNNLSTPERIQKLIARVESLPQKDQYESHNPDPDLEACVCEFEAVTKDFLARCIGVSEDGFTFEAKPALPTEVLLEAQDKRNWIKSVMVNYTKLDGIPRVMYDLPPWLREFLYFRDKIVRKRCMGILQWMRDCVEILKKAPAQAASPGRRPQSSRRSEVETFDIPAGSGWEDITLQRIDDFTIGIQLPGSEQLIQRDFRDCGMSDLKTKSPRLPWIKLQEILISGGTLPPGELNERAGRRTLKKHIKEMLCLVFGLRDDPFEWLKRGGWKLKCRVLPSTSAAEHFRDHRTTYVEDIDTPPSIAGRVPQTESFRKKRTNGRPKEAEDERTDGQPDDD